MSQTVLQTLSRQFSSAARKSRPARTGAVPAAANQLQVKPDENGWVEVIDEQTKQPYYWNQETDETTALGEPRPGAEGRIQQYTAPGTRVSSSFGSLIGMGFGVGIVFALISRVF